MSNFNFLPANGTRGGIAIFWDDTIVNMANFSQGTHHLSAMATTITDNLSFIITVVYGPSEDCDKENFLAELVAAKPPTDTPWLVMVWSSNSFMISTFSESDAFAFHLN